MQIEKGKLIGKGLTAQVYAWGDGRVLKLFERGRPAAKVEKEFTITRMVHAAGLPAPAAYGLVEVEGRKGIVFERVEGRSMFEQVVACPWQLFAAARQLAELHAQLHVVKAPAELPTLREQIAGWIDGAAELPAAEKEALRRCLATLPDGDALCHGDFHPANILLTARGPIIVDWSRATRGHPLGDVARTSHLFEVADLPEESPRHILWLFKMARAALHKTYLKHYLQLLPGNPGALEAWRPVQKAATLVWQQLQNERRRVNVQLTRDQTAA
jgi:uncharacterized protein (TIGR02172 family)